MTVFTAYLNNTAGVLLEKLLPHRRHKVEADVEDGIAEETKRVEGDKVKAEPNDALPRPVGVDLRVEGHGPGDKVDPPDDRGDDRDHARLDDRHVERRLLERRREQVVAVV